MPISFFSIKAEQSWKPLDFAADPSFYWNDGGFLSAAPVNAAATFKDAFWAATDVEPLFKWRGRRIRPSFVVPKRHHNLDQLMIVVEGGMEVASNGVTVSVDAGGFWNIEAETPYTMTVGPEGVSYLECWTGPPSLVETYWHDDNNWKRR